VPAVTCPRCPQTLEVPIGSNEGTFSCPRCHCNFALVPSKRPGEGFKTVSVDEAVEKPTGNTSKSFWANFLYWLSPFGTAPKASTDVPSWERPGLGWVIGIVALFLVCLIGAVTGSDKGKIMTPEEKVLGLVAWFIIFGAVVLYIAGNTTCPVCKRWFVTKKLTTETVDRTIIDKGWSTSTGGAGAGVGGHNLGAGFFGSQSESVPVYYLKYTKRVWRGCCVCGHKWPIDQVVNDKHVGPLEQ
jgi:hypothetical protein